MPLPLGFNVILMGEFGSHVNHSKDAGCHAHFPALIEVSRQIVEALTAYAEICAKWPF